MPADKPALTHIAATYTPQLTFHPGGQGVSLKLFLTSLTIKYFLPFDTSFDADTALNAKKPTRRRWKDGKIKLNRGVKTEDG